MDLRFWCSTAQHEVDVVIGTEFALEIKATARVSDRHLSGLRALAEEKQIKNLILTSNDPVGELIANPS